MKSDLHDVKGIKKIIKVNNIQWCKQGGDFYKYNMESFLNSK